MSDDDLVAAFMDAYVCKRTELDLWSSPPPEEAERMAAVAARLIRREVEAERARIRDKLAELREQTQYDDYAVGMDDAIAVVDGDQR